jgi:hypothetical protein
MSTTPRPESTLSTSSASSKVRLLPHDESKMPVRSTGPAARFPGLRFMTGRDPITMQRGIEACIVLHNICMLHGDAPLAESDDDSDAEDDRKYERLVQWAQEDVIVEAGADADLLPPQQAAQLAGLRRRARLDETADSLRREGYLMRRQIMNNMTLGPQRKRQRTR